MGNANTSYLSAYDTAGALIGTELIEIVQGGQVKKTTTQNIANLGGGGGGATTLQVDILYADLVAAISGNTLIKGQQYKITDYTTKQKQKINNVTKTIFTIFNRRPGAQPY